MTESTSRIQALRAAFATHRFQGWESVPSYPEFCASFTDLEAGALAYSPLAHTTLHVYV